MVRILGIEVDAADENLSRMLPALLESNPERAKLVFYKLVELIDGGRGLVWSGYSGDSYSHHLLLTILDDYPDFRTLAFAIDLLLPQDENRKPVAIEAGTLHYLAKPFEAAYRRALESLWPGLLRMEVVLLAAIVFAAFVIGHLFRFIVRAPSVDVASRQSRFAERFAPQ